ncbi:MAG: polysaccharide deacetylase family protein [Actinomycetota bacterium]|nr:polysaccharide deacetylase family protein [Actinomycetota bacterium]
MSLGKWKAGPLGGLAAKLTLTTCFSLILLISPLAAIEPAHAAWSGGHDVMGSGGARRTWFFAEGCTRTGFEEWVCLFNPGAAEAIATCTYMLGDGQVVARDEVLAPRSRTTINVGAVVPAGSDVSLAIEASQDIVAERPMYFRYQGTITGGHNVMGAEAPREEWFFAEGCSREGFDTWLCLQNPTGEAAVCDISYYCGDGTSEERVGIGLAPNSRSTIPVHETGLGLGRAGDARGDFSIAVRSTNCVPVVAERPMYFRYQGTITGGHNVMGAEAPREEWFFAEGCSREGFDTWLCLQNPTGEAAVCDISYYCGDGTSEERVGIGLAPNSRSTIPVHETGLGLGRAGDARGDFSIAVRSTNCVPVVAERPMYFRYRSLQPEWMSVDRDALVRSLGTGEIASGNTAQKRVALTFDAEQDRAATTAILDALRACDVHCTFFVLGGYADQYPDLVKRMADEGHEVASHSYSHADFAASSAEKRRAELLSAEAAISRITGYSPRPYFRFPYGSRNAAAISQLNSMGYISVYWNVDPWDWKGISAGALYSRIMSAVRPGAIVVMHTVYASQKAGALPAVIRDLRASGYEPVTVTEVLLADD